MGELPGAPIKQILAGGGAAGIKLLQYCVRSGTMEPMFVLLCAEYRLRPIHLGALALYDMFCSPEAPARIDLASHLPPRNLVLAAEANILRRQWMQMQLLEPPALDAAVPITTPSRAVFDAVVQALTADPAGRIAGLARRYDPRVEPGENLPGGRMTAGQQHFVEKVWKPVVRPRLVAAGFWRVQTIE